MCLYCFKNINKKEGRFKMGKEYFFHSKNCFEEHLKIQMALEAL